MTPFTRQALFTLAYTVFIFFLAAELDGPTFVAAFLLTTGMFFLESITLITNTWRRNTSSLGGETDSAGSGAG